MRRASIVIVVGGSFRLTFGAPKLTLAASNAKLGVDDEPANRLIYCTVAIISAVDFVRRLHLLLSS